MTKEDITRLAQEAGFVGMDGDHGALRRFADLVASAAQAKEREACAKLCGDLHLDGDNDNGLAADLIRARGEASIRGQA